MPAERERNQDATMGQQQPETDPPGKLGKALTTTDTGAKDSNLSHGVPPSARQPSS